MDNLISASEFMKHLKSEGMVIAKRELVRTDSEVELQKTRDLQSTLLRRKWLSYNDILKSKLLPYTSITGLKYGIVKMGVKPDEIAAIHGVQKVLTSAVKRIISE